MALKTSLPLGVNPTEAVKQTLRPNEMLELSQPTLRRHRATQHVRKVVHDFTHPQYVMKPSSAQDLDGMKGQLQTSLIPEPSISGPEWTRNKRPQSSEERPRTRSPLNPKLLSTTKPQP